MGREREGVEVLRSEPNMVAAVADSLGFEHKYRSIVIAWAPDDRPTDAQIEAVLDEFEKTAWAGLEPDRYSWTAVLHREPGGGVHVHVLTARCDLETGKSLNIAPPGWQKTFDPLRDALNHEHGWSRPDDPARARTQQPSHRAYIEAANLRAGLKHEADPRELIRDYLVQRLEHALGGFGERRNALDAAFLCEGVAARAGQHPVGEGLLAGLGERDEGGGAETEFAAPAADDEPLDPASGSGRLDEQVQPVAVRVASGRCGTDEGGREGLVGMAAPALGLSASSTTVTVTAVSAGSAAVGGGDRRARRPRLRVTARVAGASAAVPRTRRNEAAVEHTVIAAPACPEPTAVTR